MKPSVGSWVEIFRVSTKDLMVVVVVLLVLIWGGSKRREFEAIGILH